MRTRTRRTGSVVLAVAFGVGASLGLAGPATAAPDQEVFPLVCDNGATYSGAVNGNGAFTPARDTGSTAVLVPVTFLEFSATAVLPDGTTQSFSDDTPVTKGSVAAHSPRRLVTCSFSLTMTLTEEDDGLPVGTVVTFGGKVAGYVTPAR